MIKDKLLTREQTLLESYHRQPVFYLIRITKTLFKFGSTNDIKDRVSRHKKEIGDDIVLIHIIQCKQNRELEQNFKDNTDISARRVHEHFNNKKQTEIIRVDEHLTEQFAYDCNFGFSQTMKDYADIMYNTEIEQGISKDPSYETLCKAYVDVYCIHKAKHRLVNE